MSYITTKPLHVYAHIDARAVPCPWCDVPAGDDCRDMRRVEGGRRRFNPHPERTQAALDVQLDSVQAVIEEWENEQG